MTILAKRRRACLFVEPLEDRLVLSAALRPDAVLEWNAIALDAAKRDDALGHTPDQAGPVLTARALAIVEAAVYDAVNSIDGSYAPYMVQAPNVAPGASLEAAAAQAAHDTLAALYPDMKSMFDTALAADLARIASGPAQAGSAVGQFVASHLLAIRQNDGSGSTPAYTPGTAPGDWQPDPLHPKQKAYGVGLGNMTPFALTSGSQFLAPPPPALNSAAYTAAYDRVMTLGGDGVNTPTIRTADQTQIALFWGYDGQPGLGTPPRLYNQIAEVIARQEGNSEIQNARFFALINIAMADASISAWNTKYTYNFWRPITAIRAGATDGNPDTTADPNWTPLGAPADNGNGTNFTPAFPAYTSGHAAIGTAFFHMMADFYGTDNIAFAIGSDEFNGVTVDQNGNVRPVVTRSYTSFSQAAEENAISRIYLGVHWIFDKTEGMKQGTEVSDYVWQNFLKSRLTPNQLFVHQVYLDLLQREPDMMGLGDWSNMLDQGASRTQVVQAIENSTEYRMDAIQNLYQTLLHRPADAGGLNAFLGMMTAGAGVQQVEAAILGSLEFFQGNGGTNDGFLAAVYQDVLNRTPDSTGQTQFGQQLANGALRSSVASEVLASTEAQMDEVAGFYQQYLRRSGESAGMSAWMSTMQQGMPIDQVLVGFLASDEYFEKAVR